MLIVLDPKAVFSVRRDTLSPTMPVHSTQFQQPVPNPTVQLVIPQVPAQPVSLVTLCMKVIVCVRSRTACLAWAMASVMCVLTQHHKLILLLRPAYLKFSHSLSVRLISVHLVPLKMSALSVILGTVSRKMVLV